MGEWWTYSVEDFLLFGPRAYWRMLEAHNRALWPLHLPALLLGAAALLAALRPRPWSPRVITVALAVAWAFVGWAFLWGSYAGINWAAPYMAAAFAAQAALLLLAGPKLHWPEGRSPRRSVGLVLLALLLYPLLGFPEGRPLAQAEVFGIAPDPTSVATLGLAVMATGRARFILLPLPLLWCGVSALTLSGLDAATAWVPALSAALAVIALLLPGRWRA